MRWDGQLHWKWAREGSIQGTFSTSLVCIANFSAGKAWCDAGVNWLTGTMCTCGKPMYTRIHQNHAPHQPVCFSTQNGTSTSSKSSVYMHVFQSNDSLFLFQFANITLQLSLVQSACCAMQDTLGVRLCMPLKTPLISKSDCIHQRSLHKKQQMHGAGMCWCCSTRQSVPQRLTG